MFIPNEFFVWKQSHRHRKREVDFFLCQTWKRRFFFQKTQIQEQGQKKFHYNVQFWNKKKLSDRKLKMLNYQWKNNTQYDKELQVCLSKNSCTFRMILCLKRHLKYLVKFLHQLLLFWNAAASQNLSVN